MAGRRGRARRVVGHDDETDEEGDDEADDDDEGVEDDEVEELDDEGIEDDEDGPAYCKRVLASQKIAAE